MLSTLNIPLQGSSVNIVRQCRRGLSDVLQSKFGCVATIEGVDYEADPSIAQQKRPEKRFGVVLPSGVKVSVVKADLTNFHADAVVNAANEGLQHYGGLALALSTAGGKKIQQDSDDFISKHRRLPTGDAVIMGPGLLPCSNIIHAVGPSLTLRPSFSEISRAESLLRKTIISILDIVQEKGLQSVAIPAISSGLFNYPLPDCADVIVKTVKYYYEKPSRHLPKEILLVNNDEPTVLEMERACRQILTHQMPMNYSQAAASKSKGNTKTSPLTVQMGSVHLTLKTGYIEQQRTDVIVNTTYNRNLSGGQISNALLLRAGRGMQDEMTSAPITGNIIVTRSYKLLCQEVYHTFCTERGRDTAQQILFKSVKECLVLAADKGHKSIAFPAIGTGGLGFNKRDAAMVMSSAVADFAQTCPVKMEVHFVIFHSDTETFKAFEEEIRYLQQKASQPGFKHELGPRDESHGSRAPTPQISLNGPSNEATDEAKQWLTGLLRSSGAVVIRNNFIQHFGEDEHLQLSRLMEKGVLIKESFEKGHASITVSGESNEDVVIAGLQVEAMLCNIQREFVREEENAMLMMSDQRNISPERLPVDIFSTKMSNRMSDFPLQGLRIVKIDKVENATLSMHFDAKKKQLGCSNTQKMFQRIPAQFCEMVSHIGFHAQYAPPDDPAYGEGIYFANSVKKAMEVWKLANEEYLHFVEADVLTGTSTRGKPGLILPPAMELKPQSLYDSVDGPQISVIFSGYQALPKYIITCKMHKM